MCHPGVASSHFLQRVHTKQPGGHGSFEMTARHYARPEAVSAARTARVLELLNLDGAEAAASEELTDAEAEKVLAQLPPTTLARLVLRMQRGPHPQQS